MKNIYKIRFTLALIIFILATTGIFGIFYGINVYDLQFMPLLQRIFIDFSLIVLILFLIVAGLTFFCGRIYCSLFCPLGILQEITGFIRNNLIKKQCIKQTNFPLKYFIAAIVWGILCGGSAIVIRYTEPYSIFGSAMTGTIFGISAIIIIIIAALLKDRIFCTNFCPVGTVLGLISKVSANKIYISEICVSCGQCEKNCPSGCINSKEQTVDNETCIKCLKCLEVCPKGGIKYGINPKKEVKFSIKRRQLIIAGTALALFGSMIKAGIEIQEKIVEKLKDVILPPGAENKEKFFNKCLNCNLCVENCPQKIIVKADKEYGAIHIDYSKGLCDYNCHKCSQVCPSGAIKKLTLEEKQKTRIAMAMINEDKCSQCGECVKSCPVLAIIKENRKPPVLNAMKCIGCGACKNACHFGAIEIFQIKEQKTL